MSQDTNGSPQPSPSVLIPESPGSPNLLDPPGSPNLLDPPGSPNLLDPPGSPNLLDPPGSTNLQDPPFPEIPELPPPAPNSETYTQSFTGESNDSTATNYGSTDLRRDRLDEDNNSSSVQPQSSTYENSNASTVLQSLNEDSNTILLYPEAQVRKSDTHTEEPPAKIRKVSSPNKSEELDGETCPICLESWSNTGEHRLVALKCGHLFGLNCVERWLRAKPIRERACPTCKCKAHIKEVRHIYARRLVAADTSWSTALQKQIDELQMEKSRAELELQKSRIAHRACLLQLEVLRSTLLKSQVTKDPPVRRPWRFALEKNMEICKDGGCRVLTYNCRTYELYVSQKSTNYLFPGYGIRKVSCVDYKLGQFVHLHPKPIRDITYSQQRDLLLSVGLDSSARIIERGIPKTTIQAGYPLWSCSWDYMRSNELYVGGVGGVIHQYDIRNTSSYIDRLTNPSDVSPVVSLCSTEYGLLSCQLNSCWLWVSNMRRWEQRALPIEGPFMSLSYDNEFHSALVSCRPGANGERSRLALCKIKMNASSGEVFFDTEQTFNGSARSSVMSRATWVKAPGSCWVAAHSESESSLFLHGVDGARTMSLPASEPALDICSVQLNGDTFVSALSESRLRMYKAMPTNS